MASFTGIYFTKTSSDIYATFTGGTNIPAESEYDSTKPLSRVAVNLGTYDSRGLQSGSTAGGAGRNSAQHKINTIKSTCRLDHVTWNSDRTELTFPLAFNLIADATEDQWHDETEWFSMVQIDRPRTIEGSTGYIVVHADVWADGVGEEIFNIDTFMPGVWTGTENGSPSPPNQFNATFKDENNNNVGVPWDSNDNALIPLNGPNGSSIYETNGASLSNISPFGSTATAVGDPHIKTFDGTKYTL